MFKLEQQRLAVRTHGRAFHDLTAKVSDVVEESGVITGLCNVFVQHTSCSLVIQENADAAVRRDLARWIEKLCPESGEWEHDDEGPDDMPSHLRSALTHTSETIPVSEGRLALGTWQAIYLWEHRTAPHTRSVVVHVQGTDAEGRGLHFSRGGGGPARP